MPELLRVTKSVTFDAAHRVPGHPKCGNLHGHTWRVEATVDGAVGPDGMVFDFGLLGAALKEEIHAAWDHRTILGVDDPVGKALEAVDQVVAWIPGPPTAENLALTAAALIRPRLPASVRLSAVAVHETSTCHVEVRFA